MSSTTGRPRIGVVFDHIESAYHVELIESATRAARRRRARVVLIPGGALTSSGTPGRARGFLYDFMRSAPLDALLILGGTLSNYCGVEAFDHWVRGLPEMPKVVVGIEVPSAASVAVDNRRGVGALVDHLVEDHGRRHIAFIAGPEGSYESEIRKRAYLDSVERHELGLGDSYVVSGGLAREQGIDAVVHLLEDRHMTAATLDGIVCANDEVALGVLEELARRKIVVPRQVSVVGFDDAPIAHAADPPLTTVCQRVYEQGAVAMDHLLDALDDGAMLEGKTIRPDVVVRSSCGCRTPMRNDTGGIDAIEDSKGPPLQILNQRAQGIAHQLNRVARKRLRGGSAWERRIVDTLLGDLETGKRRLVREFEYLARRSGPTGFEVCHEVLTELRKEACACGPEDLGYRIPLEDLLQETRLTLADVALFVEGQQKAAQAVHLRVVSRAALDRAHGAGLPELAVALEEQLPLLGIRDFVISRGNEDVLEIVARAHARQGARSSTVTSGSLGFDEALEQQDVVVVLPLSAAGHQVGLAALEWGKADPFIFEPLRDLLGMALGVE